MACMRTYRDKLYPSSELKYFEKNCENFFYFMTERQNVWHNRFIKKLPRDKWTEDPVLRKSKYTNVYRQLDRGSLWSIQYIMQPAHIDFFKNKLEQFKTVLFNVSMYKIANRIETFEQTGIPVNIDNFNFMRFYKRVMRYSETAPVTTSAHLTIPCRKGVSKAEGLCMAVLDLMLEIDDRARRCLALFDEFLKAPHSQNKEDYEQLRHNYAEKFFKILLETRSAGGFIAYEIYCDLCYSGLIPFTTNDFANIGPGAIEGIRMMYPSATTIKEKYEKILWLLHTQDKKFKKFGFDFKYYNKFEPVEDRLSLRTIEHSLCEYSKYFLQCRNVGKVRMIYNESSAVHNCTVNPDTGDDLIPTNKDLYEQFAVRSESLCGGKYDRKGFLKQHSITKEGISDFVTGLRKQLE